MEEVKTNQVTQKREFNKKDGFEFIFTINDNIICKREFYIVGFRQKSLCSLELKDSFDYCVSLIKNNLLKKTYTYLWLTAPQVFETSEQMEQWVKSQRFELEVPSYVILKDSEEIFVWNGKEMEKYEKFFNRNEWIEHEETPNKLKFALLLDGNEIISTEWDGNVYPKFVRNNIDLSNSKNKYEGNGVFAPFEASLIKLINKGESDIIPQIIKEICICCSGSEPYTISDTYGETTYDFDIQGEWNRYVNKLGKELAKKTTEYFNTL